MPKSVTELLRAEKPEQENHYCMNAVKLSLLWPHLFHLLHHQSSSHHHPILSGYTLLNLHFTVADLFHVTTSTQYGIKTCSPLSTLLCLSLLISFFGKMSSPLTFQYFCKVHLHSCPCRPTLLSKGLGSKISAGICTSVFAFVFVVVWLSVCGIIWVCYYYYVWRAF